MPVSRRLAVVALALTLPLSACGEDILAGSNGAVGPDEEVSEDVEVVAAQLEYPLDGLYEEGEDARLFVAITNQGTTPAELVDVTGDAFTDARLTGGAADGAIVVPAGDNVYVGAEGSPEIVLEGLAVDLRSSQSVPVTFVFADAGEVTLEVPVGAAGQTPSPPFDFPDPAEDVDPA